MHGDRSLPVWEIQFGILGSNLLGIVIPSERLCVLLSGGDLGAEGDENQDAEREKQEARAEYVGEG